MAEKKEPSQRQLRVGQEIKKLVASMLEKGEIRDEVVQDSFITITEARISPDLKYCSIYLMTLNGDKIQEVVDAMNGYAWFVRKQLGAKLKLRYTPEVNFRVDDTFEQVDHIERLLRDPRVVQDLKDNI